MQAVSPAQGPFDGSVLMHQQHRQKNTHSNSLSSGSVVTIRRPASISRVRSESSESRGGDAALIPLRLGRNSVSSEHGRAQSIPVQPLDLDQPSVAPFIAGSGDVLGMSSVNRWSHSTTSSVASHAHKRRHRSSSSGAILSALSPRTSPQKSRRRQSSVVESQAGIPPLQTTPALTDPNDTESPSTTQTVSTPPIPSPGRLDYFGGNEDFAPYGMAKTQQRVVMVRNQTAPVAVRPHTRTMGSGTQETAHHASAAPRHEPQHRPNREGEHRRTRERTEKDKKAMLSKALQKANTAVLLDNAQNYEGALEAYGDACDLLGQVMHRTSGDDDKRKLDAIRVTYSNRMEELRQLVDELPSMDDEKNLPARPMSAESQPLSPNASLLSNRGIDNALRAEGYVEASLKPERANAPRLSYAHNDRDSFYARTMAAVESSTGFQPDASTRFQKETSEDIIHDQHSVVGAEQVEDSRQGRNPVHLPPPQLDEYMPRPLSPKRVQPPTDQPHADDDWDNEALRQQKEVQGPTRSRSDSKDSISWLDTIDESASSCSDSVHSFSSQQEVRRKHIRGISGVTDPDFDAAFDAAVEAAYDEGLEPDMEARTKQMAAYRRRQDESINVPASEIDEITPGALKTSKVVVPDVDEEEEERILDEMTNEYGQGFNFDLQSKSALPRQSDSSGYSRSTWQSSQMSDRATVATSLSTVAEDVLAQRFSKGARIDPTALPPATAPPRGSLPRPPSAGNGGRLPTVRSRRLSSINSKQLKIETAAQPHARQRASTFHHTGSPFLEEHEGQDSSEQDSGIQSGFSSLQHDHLLRSPPSLELHSALDETKTADSTVTDHRPSYEPADGDLLAARPTLFRKNKSSASLRDHTEHTVLLASPDPESGFPMATPMSTTFMTFAAKRNNNNNPLTSQRVTLPSLGPGAADSHMAGGTYLFDTSLSATPAPMSPRSPNLSPQPTALEPCPESFLLRPFWLMRALSSTIIHPKGGFLTTKMFVPREVWQSTGVKLKAVEDKIANCDLLTAALGRLAGVDTYDADAIMDELLSFEEVMERVQAALSKKLGSDVGVQGVAGMFKDASAATVTSAMGNVGSDNAAASDKAAKSNSGKSYLSSWRKLRNKSSGTPLSTGSQMPIKPAPGQDQHTIPSVPMTSFVPVERRGNKRDARNLVFEGPNKEYMGSLARLFDGVQVLGKSTHLNEDSACVTLACPHACSAKQGASSTTTTRPVPSFPIQAALILGLSLTHCVFATDQIARQVEDPGLKHSSPTHVGLELSIRHAAEFFGFFVCRFVLADLGLLMDKFVKKGTEWVLA